jgi:co-chaperonin GroES (HSP10)
VTIEFKQILLDDFIVVALIDEPAAMGRIKLPDWQRTLRGEVTAAGPGRILPFGGRAPMECKPGDIVTFAATAGMDTDYGVGRKIRMMRDPDVDSIEVPGRKLMPEEDTCPACGCREFNTGPWLRCVNCHWSEMP